MYVFLKGAKKHMQSIHVSCRLCGNDVHVSQVHCGQNATYAVCEECTGISQVLEHRHILSLDAPTLKEFTSVTGQLAQLDQPTDGVHYAYHAPLSHSSPEGDAYWLCYHYDQVSIHLLKTLVSLRLRYTLHDVVTHTDSLRFWPGYAAPQGICAPLLASPPM